MRFLRSVCNYSGLDHVRIKLVYEKLVGTLNSSQFSYIKIIKLIIIINKLVPMLVKYIKFNAII